MEKLKSYMEAEKISAATLAAQVGVTRQYIWALAKGASLPRVDLAVRIDDATGGAVPVRCWGRGSNPASQDEAEARQ